MSLYTLYLTIYELESRSVCFTKLPEKSYIQTYNLPPERYQCHSILGNNSFLTLCHVFCEVDEPNTFKK